MVRVSFFVVMSTLFLASCATEQQGNETLAEDLLDCMPKATLSDVLTCASQKQNAATAPAPQAKAQSAS